MSGAVFRGLDVEPRPISWRKPGVVADHGGMSDEELSVRGVIAGVCAAVIILLFAILAFTLPRFEVHRSVQAEGAIAVSVPDATTRAFLAMSSAEVCADARGIGRAEGIRPVIRAVEGVSYMTQYAWREECGGMALSIPLRGAVDRVAARRTLEAFQAAVVAVERGRERAAGDAAAAFHEVARRSGVGYRLVGYALR